MAVVIRRGPAPPLRRASRASRRRCACLGVAAAALLAVGCRAAVAFTATPKVTSLQQPAARESKDRIARASGVVSSLSNPVKTVSETINEFYKAYPGPPILPMYRGFIIDFLTQTHLTVVDERFKYDAIFALGVLEYYQGLMGNYDKLLGGDPAADKILVAFLNSLGMDVEKVKSDAAAVRTYASSTTPAQILQQMEGTEAAAEKVAGDAFTTIGSSLYSSSFSVGLFKMMELASVETTKANVEEWAKALKITPPSKATSDLETYRQNKKKLQQAEEMLREVEIREKKKLAERLEEKAKKLAAKAAGTAKEDA